MWKDRVFFPLFSGKTCVGHAKFLCVFKNKKNGVQSCRLPRRFFFFGGGGRGEEGGEKSINSPQVTFFKSFILNKFFLSFFLVNHRWQQPCGNNYTQERERKRARKVCTVCVCVQYPTTAEPHCRQHLPNQQHALDKLPRELRVLKILLLSTDRARKSAP